MQIQVAGKQLDLSDALKQRVTTHLDTIANRYFDSALDAQVTFSKARSFFTCDINVHAGRGLTLRGEGEASDANSAFDDAAEHIARRLRRYHKRFSEHARIRPRNAMPEVARNRVISRPSDHDARLLDDQSTGLDLLGFDQENATVIAEQPSEIVRLSVSEAVMRLDLANQRVLMFRNVTSEEINVIYRREDGHIGWLDTSPRLAS